METKIEKIDKNKINEEIIEEAGMILKNGGLVAFPTETVYGLGADALKEEAAMKTYAAKGRPSDNPLIVHIAEYEDLRKIAVNIPAETDALAAHFWPGPLTMIFEKSEVVPYGTTGGLDTVAVRMPTYTGSGRIRFCPERKYFGKTKSDVGGTCCGRFGRKDRYDLRRRSS